MQDAIGARVSIPGPALTQHGSRAFGPLVADLLGEDDPDWTLREDAQWLRCIPADCPERDQGWKLHVSATLGSADDVLRRVVPALAAERCSFKVAATRQALSALNDARAPRGSSGKFVTVYPRDDAQLRRVAEVLHQATEGCAGPRILSDRPYRPGSLVHLRFGVFSGHPLIDVDGGFHNALRDPDGNLVEDRREPTFAPPPWVDPPLPPAEWTPELRPASAAAVLLADRFVVRQAIRHANKGGVFRARDTRTGADVVIKQARAHVGGRPGGPDVQGMLRNEAGALRLLEPLRRSPRCIDLFEQEGDLFLAEELLAATSLREWMTRRSAGDPGAVPAAELTRLALDVAGLVAHVHALGVAIRDLTPNNLLVDERLGVWLIDLELAVHAETSAADVTLTGGTPGYAAPEQLAGAAPDVSADLWSLGAVLCFLFAGQDPYVDPASITSSSPERRLDGWLRARHRRPLMPADVQQVVRSLMRDDPAARIEAQAALEALRAADTSEPRPSSGELAVLALRGLATPRSGALLVRDLLDGILAERQDGTRPWATSSFGATTDPRCVQHGAAGVLGVLVQAHRALGDGRLLDAVAFGARWLAPRLRQELPGPVGLHFGSAGPVWALAQAADVLDDGELRRIAVETALRQPADWPSPDVTHGRAGLGLALLQLWRQTGEDALLARAHEVADTLVRDAEVEPDGTTSWRTAAGAASTFAGKRFYGFAHGAAGIAAFLLEVGRISGRVDCLRLARGAVETLLAAGVEQDGSVAWGSSPEERRPTLPYWCNGSAGVGTFLLRAHRYLADDRLLPAIDGAARSVMAAKWSSGVSYCHGLSGNADFVLEAAEVLGEQTYKRWANDLAAVLEGRAVRHSGRLALTDTPGRIPLDFAVGTAGCISFLLRAQHGGPRLWLPEIEVPAR